MPAIPKSQSAFSLKAAGRSLSWGRNNGKNTTPPPSKNLPSLPAEDEFQPRSRAVTASSYASTATPPKLDERDLGWSLGGDFADMFSGFGKRKSAQLEPLNDKETSQSPVRMVERKQVPAPKLISEQDISPAGPASRSYASTRHKQPSALNIDKNKNVEASPYSWSSQHSRDGLISNSSPPPFAPRTDEQAPAVLQHLALSRTSNTSPNLSRQQRPGGLADGGLRRNSGYSGRRKSTVEYGESIDEDARLLRESVNASRRLNDSSYNPRVRDSWAVPSDRTNTVDDSAISSWAGGSVETTPRARQAEVVAHEDSIFDDHIAEAANLALRFEETPASPPMQRQSPTNKVMTPAQFERYRQDQERMRSLGGKSKDDEDEEEEIYDDEEDEAEKKKQLAKQRRKQEAHMAVYRQQMMKVTGETPTAPRPSITASQSSPNLNLGQPEEGEEEDEEVPLAILQAHGFPNKNKPPMRSVGSNPNLRAPSAMGGPLPVFARNLPQDPYFGAGIVHPTNRESLAFGGGAGSTTGGTPRGLPAGGLVGVIATEERSRAMRRGSPNAQGEYGPPPSNGFSGMGMSASPSMMNGMGGMSPMGPMGPVNPMMLSPGDQAQLQMSQQMQQFMQMQMQFMQMMTQGQGPPALNGQQVGGMQRPHSAQGPPQLRPGSSHQRAMSSLDPNSAPWMQQGGAFTPSIHTGGYAPSIAPSERSNIGLPGRYRPVSQVHPVDNKSRTSTMSGALHGWENKHGQATIKAVKKSADLSDEDDEEGWEEMAKKREKKRSLWRTKKDTTNGLKEMLGYTQ